VAFCETMERLACDKILSDPPFEFDAASAVFLAMASILYLSTVRGALQINRLGEGPSHVLCLWGPFRTGSPSLTLLPAVREAAAARTSHGEARGGDQIAFARILRRLRSGGRGGSQWTDRPA